MPRKVGPTIVPSQNIIFSGCVSRDLALQASENTGPARFRLRGGRPAAWSSSRNLFALLEQIFATAELLNPSVMARSVSIRSFLRKCDQLVADEAKDRIEAAVAAMRIAVDLNLPPFEVDDPVKRDLDVGVSPKLDARILAIGGVGHLNQERDILRPGRAVLERP